MTSVHDELRALVRTIPDFPRPGIQFRDITTLLLDSGGFARTIDALAGTVVGPVDLVGRSGGVGQSEGGDRRRGGGTPCFRRDHDRRRRGDRRGLCARVWQ